MPDRDWPAPDLGTENMACLAKRRWPRFGFALSVQIAQAWEGGMGATAIAQDLGCSTGTIAMLLGSMRQSGAALRKADNCQPAPRQPRAVQRVESEGPPAFDMRVRDVRGPTRGNVTRHLMGDPPPGRTPWSAS